MANRGRPGRPPTAAEIEKVKMLVEVKAPICDIAKALDRSIPNLKKYFSEYLIFQKKKKPLPQRKITEADRERVIRYVGCRMSSKDIARVFDMTVGEVEEYFPEELAGGRAKYRAKVIDNLHEQMEDGTVGATNRLEALSSIPDPKEGETPGAASIRPGPNLGKKAAAAAAAGAAATGGGAFAPPPPPAIKMVVNNGEKK